MLTESTKMLTKSTKMLTKSTKMFTESTKMLTESTKMANLICAVHADKKLTVRQISYDDLKQSAQRAHDEIVEGRWTSNQAKNFLYHHCMNTGTIKSIVDCAQNVRKKKLAIESDDKEKLKSWEILHNADPSKYEQWKPLPIWNSGLDLQQTTEPAMHELFLGVTKSVISETQEWCSLRHKFATLKRYLGERNRAIMELHLSWCKIQPYAGDKLGGWVSENYMGFARIIPWAYAGLNDLASDKPFIAPEGRPVSKWRADECKAFLRERRLPIKGRVKELRKRVAQNRYVERSGPVGGQVVNARSMLLSLWSMLCYLMGMKTSNDEEVGTSAQLIRVFLTCCADFDKEISPFLGRSKPFWLTAYNFSCLLNIPNQIHMLGLIHNRWEGGWRGEGILREIKPIILGKRKNKLMPTKVSSNDEVYG